MEVTEKRQNGISILGLLGRLDSNTSLEFEKRLFEVIEDGHRSVIVDFDGLDYISSAGLRVLLKATKELKGILAACYYGCLQTRFPFKIPIHDDVENPQGMERILKLLKAKTVDWSYKTDCCGASASVDDESTAFNLMAKIMKDALARGANCLVVTCLLCQLNLDAYQDKFCKHHEIQDRLPVFFITELIGLALGMDPDELQIDRHFIDGSQLLKELDLI